MSDGPMKIHPLLLVALTFSLLCVYVSFCVVLIARPWSGICAFAGSVALGFVMGRQARR